MWQRLSPRERRLFVVAVGAAVLVLLYRMAFLPTVRRLRTLSGQVAVAQAEVRAMEATLKLRRRIEVEHQRFSSLLTGAGSDEEEMSELLREVNLAATKHGVEPRTIDPRPYEYEPFCRRFVAYVEVRGRAAPLCRFLHELEASGSLISFRTLDLRALSEAGSLQAGLTVVKIAAPASDRALEGRSPGNGPS